MVTQLLGGLVSRMYVFMYVLVQFRINKTVSRHPTASVHRGYDPESAGTIYNSSRLNLLIVLHSPASIGHFGYTPITNPISSLNEYRWSKYSTNHLTVSAATVLPRLPTMDLVSMYVRITPK